MRRLKGLVAFVTLIAAGVLVGCFGNSGTGSPDQFLIPVEYTNAGPLDVHMDRSTIVITDENRVNVGQTRTASVRITIFNRDEATAVAFQVARPDGVLDTDTLIVT